MDRVWDFLHRFKSDWRLLWIILAADLAGMVFGWYYYWDVGQFDPASRYYQHWSWWPLVADSPNAVLLLFVSVLVYKTTGRRSKILDSLAFVLNLYVGLWTTFYFLAFPDIAHTWDWGGTNNILFFAHLGMPLQALILVKDLKADRFEQPTVVGLLVVFTLYLGVDYWGPHLHPAPFLGTAKDATLHAGAPWLMVAAVAAWLALLAPGFRVRAPAGTAPP